MESSVISTIFITNFNHDIILVKRKYLINSSINLYTYDFKKNDNIYFRGWPWQMFEVIWAKLL